MPVHDDKQTHVVFFTRNILSRNCALHFVQFILNVTLVYKIAPLWKVTKLSKDQVPVGVFPCKLIRRSLIALYIMILIQQKNNEMSPCIFSSTRYGCAHSSCQMNQEWFTRGQRLVMMLSCMWISELMAHHSYLIIIPEIPQEKWNNLSPNAKGLYSLCIYIYTFA